MNRRGFIAGLGGVTVWPLAARAQQAMPVIGFLRSTTFSNAAHLVQAFRRGLKEAGFEEGQNVAIEFRAAEYQTDRLPAIATEFARRPVSVIIGETTSAQVAKTVTTTVPIVFTTAGDPVRDGLVASLNRPGGNITGVSFLGAVLGSKRLELIRQFVPRATTIGLIAYPASVEARAERSEIEDAAKAMGLHLVILDVSTKSDIEAAFATLAQRGAGALLVGAASFLSSNRELLVTLAARHRLPTMYHLRDDVALGGLMSYGSSNAEAYRQAGVYAGRILKGEKPSDLPVVQAAKFEMVINLKTAKALGMEIPGTLLALTDEVIE